MLLVDSNPTIFLLTSLNLQGYGYHLDLCVLAFLIFVVGILGLPIYVAATVLSINHVNSLKLESESRAPGEVAQFIGVRWVIKVSH